LRKDLFVLFLSNTDDVPAFIEDDKSRARRALINCPKIFLHRSGLVTAEMVA